MHEAMTYFTKYSFNFCQPVRTLRERADLGSLAKADRRDGGRIGRSRVVTQGMANLTGRSTALGHDRYRRARISNLFLELDDPQDGLPER